MTNKIVKWGNSLAVRIPKQIAQEAALEAGDEISIATSDTQIIITPQKKKYTLEELLEGMEQVNLHDEADWGKTEGQEIW